MWDNFESKIETKNNSTHVTNVPTKDIISVILVQARIIRIRPTLPECDIESFMAVKSEIIFNKHTKY